MFLVDSAEAGADWEGVLAAIQRILKKADAEIVSIRKWDERRLAYEIKGIDRVTYILCYFKADGGEIQAIEKAVQLSEKIMRVLILNAEQLTAGDIEKDTPATKVEKEKEKRQAAIEAAEETEAEQPSDQQEKQTAEEAKPEEEAKRDEQAKPDEEAKLQADTEPGEEAMPDEEAKLHEEAKPDEEAKLDEEVEQDEKAKLPHFQQTEDLREPEPKAPADD
jgi:small subunit ribosomal protein S6